MERIKNLNPITPYVDIQSNDDLFNLIFEQRIAINELINIINALTDRRKNLDMREFVNHCDDLILRQGMKKIRENGKIRYI